MTDLVVRRPRFNFTGEDVPWAWNPQNPAFSFFMNATSIIAICFEQMIVAAVQEARPLIADPKVSEEAAAFLRQEAQHSSTHRKHVAALIKHYPGLRQTFDAAAASFDEVTATKPLKFRLAYVADLEATFTPAFKMMLDNEETLFCPGDDRVASLLMWHFVEEVEHRSSALVIYDAVVGEPWYRVRALPAVVKHLLQVVGIIADGVNAHVPEADRKVDARTLLPVFGMRETLRQRVARGSKHSAPSAFSSVPRKEILTAAGRVLLSQTPFHDPAHEPLPEFADRWFERWERGGDVTRWYTGERVVLSPTMADQCNATFDHLAHALGDVTCRDAPAFVHLRNPFGLSNWTLPVLESMMVVGAVLALWYSIRRLRRDGDPTNLALWLATVVYLFVIEIPLYFPNVFGVEDRVGVVFAHNAFTVQFLFERLPLYIIALYPAVVTLAFEVVRSLGVFRDRGMVLGAIGLGFVHHCLYEVFDQLGPQLRWWAWNTDNPINHPMLAAVPMTSMFIFATLGPIVVTVLVMLLVGRKALGASGLSGASLAWRTAAAGALVPIGLALLSIPSSLFGGEEPNATAQATVFSVELFVVAAMAVPVLIRQWLHGRRDGFAKTPPNAFVRIFGPGYLLILAILWATALPEYFGATDGITADGTPVGSLGYATACFVAAALAIVSVAGTTMVPRSPRLDGMVPADERR